MQRVAHGSAGELGGDAAALEQLVVQRHRALVIDEHGAALGELVAPEQLVRHPRVHVHQSLVDTHDVDLRFRHVEARVMEQRVSLVHREVVLVLATTGEAHDGN